jgi:hypothetical protein
MSRIAIGSNFRAGQDPVTDRLRHSLPCDTGRAQGLRRPTPLHRGALSFQGGLPAAGATSCRGIYGAGKPSGRGATDGHSASLPTLRPVPAPSECSESIEAKLTPLCCPWSHAPGGVQGWQWARHADTVHAHPAGGRRVPGCGEAGRPLEHAGGMRPTCGSNPTATFIRGKSLAAPSHALRHVLSHAGGTAGQEPLDEALVLARTNARNSRRASSGTSLR